MKRILEKIAAAMLATLVGIASVTTAAAISTSRAVEKIDLHRDFSLRLTCRADGMNCPGLKLEIFQTADVTEDWQYTLTAPFAAIHVKLNGIGTQSEWDELCETVGAYITADKIAPTASGATGNDGAVKFEDLKPGIYYVRCTGGTSAGRFAPFMICVPNLGDDGKWIYDVDALPKPGPADEPPDEPEPPTPPTPPTPPDEPEPPTPPDEPETETMTLVKLWRDGSRSAERPETVSMEIYRDGDLYKKVQLTAADDWMFTWETEKGHTWIAVEREVPEGYTVSVQGREGNTFRITNTLEEEPEEEAPQTGDAAPTYLWIMGAALIGLALTLIGGRKPKEDE